MIKIKRVYEPPAGDDGCRILVDRLWPRGLKKDDSNIDKWMKEISPSPDLRKWFNHEPAKWKLFSEEYTDELKQSPAVDELLKYIAKHPVITLLYAAKDTEHTHALVLQKFINNKLQKNK